MDWFNLLLLVALSAGHTELLVTLVNRTHGYRIPERVLKQIRHVHDALLLAFPVLLFLAVGFGGPRLLWGGSWANLPTLWWPVIGLCGVGFLGLLISTARWQLHSSPPVQANRESRVIDFAKRIDRPLVAAGPKRFLTRVPFNEIFQVEFNTKTFHLSRIPGAWSELTILHLSDFHYVGTLSKEFYVGVCRELAEWRPDLIVFTGDLIDNEDLIDWIPETLGLLSAPLGCHFILGNHDWRLDDGGDVRQALRDIGWADVASRTFTLEHQGRSFVIAGDETPWMGTHPSFGETPDDVFRLLLSHTPDNVAWALENRVDLMLSGHNHGGQVVLPVVGPVYSPSRFGVKYGGGGYWLDPMLLHVSRGLSAVHPLRLRCRPEVTMLTLKPRA